MSPSISAAIMSQERPMIRPVRAALLGAKDSTGKLKRQPAASMV
jgi:hypothetical protein